MTYIYHHMGLGDHIICNGLVRNLIEPNIKYTMFVKPHNYTSVSFMYRDIPNLEFIKTDDYCAINILNNSNDKIIIGFNSKQGLSWDEFFYYQHSIDFKKRWLDFKVERDFEKEIFLFNKLNPNNEKYILIHKNGSDFVDRINYSILNEKLKKIYVENLTDNIFDYLTLAEKAEEIHCVDSSFLHLVDTIFTQGKLYYHNLTKTRNPTESHKQIKNWILV